MSHHRFASARRMRRLAAAVLGPVVLSLGFAAVPAHAVSVTALEKGIINTAQGERIEGVYEPNGDNKLWPAGQPYDIGAPWCGSFLNWVMKQNGITVSGGGGRQTFNVNVARAWGYYGAGGGGYGRWATAKNAMPGDVLVHRYDGTATTGGHVSVVIANGATTDEVWTVGGNEGDRVQIRKLSLTGVDRGYLVTLSEFRSRVSNIWSEATGAPQDVGDLTVKRWPNGTTPSVQVTKIVYKGTTYSGTTLGNSGFVVKRSSTTTNLGITSIVATHGQNWVVADRAGDQASMATQSPTIRTDLAGTSTKTS